MDDEPLDLAPGHRFELLGDDAVVAALDEVLVDVMHEGHERVLGFFAHFLGAAALKKLQILLQRLIGQKFKLRHCRYPCGSSLPSDYIRAVLQAFRRALGTHRNQVSQKQPLPCKV